MSAHEAFAPAAAAPTGRVSQIGPRRPSRTSNTGETLRQNVVSCKTTPHTPTSLGPVPCSRRRETAVDELSRSQQGGFRQINLDATKEGYFSPTAAGGSGGRRPRNRSLLVTTPSPSTRWRDATNSVLTGLLSRDVIVNTESVAQRNSSHEARINEMIPPRRCRRCIEIVENQTRELHNQRRRSLQEGSVQDRTTHGIPSADPESVFGPEAATASLVTSEDLGLVWSFFDSVHEVISLDSMYKKHIFRELRIKHFSSGSIVFRQREPQTMVIGSIEPNIWLLTATCEGATTLLCLDCECFKAVVTDSAIAERVAKKGLLRCSFVFSTLGDDDLDTLENLFTTITLHDKQVLCQEGSRVDHVYVVKRGFLRVLKAFLPEDDDRCSRSAFKATARDRSAIGSTPRPSHVDSRATFADAEERLQHFDLGEIGPKDMLGENGVLQQFETTSSTPAPATENVMLPAIESNQGDQSQSKKQHATTLSVDNGASKGGPLPPDSAADAVDSSPTTTARPRKPTYIVSAIASGGTAEVYIADAYDVKRLQAGGFRYCWKTAQKLHHVREQAWSAEALAQHLWRQTKWEALKRTIVAESLLTKKMSMQ